MFSFSSLICPLSLLALFDFNWEFYMNPVFSSWLNQHIYTLWSLRELMLMLTELWCFGYSKDTNEVTLHVFFYWCYFFVDVDLFLTYFLFPRKQSSVSTESDSAHDKFPPTVWESVSHTLWKNSILDTRFVVNELLFFFSYRFFSKCTSFLYGLW